MAKHSVKSNPPGLKAWLEGVRCPFSLNISPSISFGAVSSYNTSPKGRGRGGTWDTGATQDLFLQTDLWTPHCLDQMLGQHGPPTDALTFRSSGSFRCWWRTDADTESHCQCSYWNFISRLQHVTLVHLPGNSELIIKSISLFIWLWILLAQKSFMAPSLSKISAILWRQQWPNIEKHGARLFFLITKRIYEKSFLFTLCESQSIAVFLIKLA